jgi:hypothetical protein
MDSKKVTFQDVELFIQKEGDAKQLKKMQTLIEQRLDEIDTTKLAHRITSDLDDYISDKYEILEEYQKLKQMLSAAECKEINSHSDSFGASERGLYVDWPEFNLTVQYSSCSVGCSEYDEALSNGKARNTTRITQKKLICVN